MTTPNPAGAHSKKRKLADGEQDDDQTNQHDDAARPKAKKSKHSQVAPQQDTKKSRGLSQEYPTGFVHCHQCTKKRDATLVVQCTIKASDVLVAATRATARNAAQSKVSLLLAKKVLQIPKESAEDKALPGKAKPANSTKNSKAAKASGSSASGSKKTAKAPARLKPKAAPQPVPRPVWTRVPTSLSNGDVETRMHIREFILRFATALAIPHNQLDELDELSGEELGDATNSEDEDEESVELVGWVSEPCVKSIVLGLLHVIVGGAEGRNAHRETKALEEAIQNVKSSGANLNKLWGALVSLREEEDFSLEFSDPLPPPASNTCRSTRSGGVDSILVATSAQLVPVIADLIEATMTIPAMHKAIDAGFTEEKNLTTNMQAAIKKRA
ncbi:hypothetical protein EW026_g707 [Hermanssonia centrifuga]|uniref:Uncharacterized protein n=1 Tax=Hermanssonia centrifuga TaxID=98765 RepID=A0A4S4KTP8_9APHY|nr:hypothetical protein EW026_g707 [Hermanssonia centrifuga]